MLLPHGGLSYSILSCQGTHCWMLHEQTISVRSNVREWTHALLVNTPYSHLQSFCVAAVSRRIATRVTLTCVSRVELAVSEAQIKQHHIRSLCRSTLLLFGLCFKWYTVCILHIKISCANGHFNPINNSETGCFVTRNVSLSPYWSRRTTSCWKGTAYLLSSLPESCAPRHLLSPFYWIQWNYINSEHWRFPLQVEEKYFRNVWIHSCESYEVWRAFRQLSVACHYRKSTWNLYSCVAKF
jgi:hypothetical protein